MLRIGEVTRSQHILKAPHIHIGSNKNKILLILYSSKTHSQASGPQQIKITEDKIVKNTNTMKQCVIISEYVEVSKILMNSFLFFQMAQR